MCRHLTAWSASWWPNPPNGHSPWSCSGFGTVIAAVADTLEFHRLAHYLFGLATAFIGFYETCPVLRAEGEVRDSRLVLCDLTARTLARGLDILGITAPDRM